MAEMRVVFLCVAGALVCTVMRPQRPEFRLAVALAAGLAALGLSLDGMRSAVQTLGQLASEAGMSASSSSLLIRATGLTMISEFGAQLCRDSEESALAGRVELAGRVALLGMSVPLLSDLTGRIMRILP